MAQRIQANQEAVARALSRLVPTGDVQEGGWLRRLEDPVTGERWWHRYLGASGHGGGLPILVRDPRPATEELIRLAATSEDMAEVAASCWLLEEMDRAGDFKGALLGVATDAVRAGDLQRATTIIGWGRLGSKANLRPTLGKTPAEVTRDTGHFISIADRAGGVLGLSVTDSLLRDPAIFTTPPASNPAE